MELLSVTMNDGVMPRSEIEGKDNSSEDKSNYKVVLTGDMVYNSMRMWQGANGISPCDGIVSPAYTVLMPKIPISNGYFAAFFKSPNLINEFRKNSQGMTSDTWNLKYPQIETIKVCIPALSEQNRVADMLRTLERRIAKQAQLVDNLKKYKRGLIKLVFEKVMSEAHYQLPLSDLCISISSGRTTVNESNGRYPLFGSTGIVGMTNTIEHDGDIVMVARVGANAGKVNFFSGRCGVTDNTLVIRVKENTIHPKFLAYFLENFDLHKLIFGSGQPLVTGGQLKKIQSPVIAYKAQLLITRSLESLDRIIGTQDTYMEKLIQLKSGLMQRLFI